MSEEHFHPIEAHLGCVAALERHRLSDGRDIVIQALLRHACDANAYRAGLATRRGLSPSELGLGIRVSVDAQQEVLVTRDDGIGLTEEQLHAHFGNLSALSDASAGEDVADHEPLTEGAYFRRFSLTILQILSFAEEITVESLSHQPDSRPCRLVYSGGEQYRFGPGQLEAPGTLIQVRPRPAYRHLCDVQQVPQLVRQYGDFLQFPILWEGRQVNTMSPPWHQPVATVADYTAFLRNRYPQMPAPLLVVPVSVQRGPIDVRGVLWVPGRRLSLLEDGLGTVELYWRRMLQHREQSGALPRWARFVTGILDSNVRPEELCNQGVAESGGLYLPAATEQTLLGAFRHILVDQARSFLPVAQRQDQLLKLAAMEHDELFAVVADHLLFKTSSGRQTLGEYLSEVVQATGEARIYYHSVPVQSFWSVSRAQALPLIDTSEGLDEAVLRKYDQANPAVELVNIEQTRMSLVEELSGPQYRPLVELFAELDPPVTVRPARFSPTSVSATISPAGGDPMGPQLEQLFLLSQITGAMPTEARSAMQRALAARAGVSPQRVVHINMGCPSVRALLAAVQAGKQDIARQVAQMLVIQAHIRVASPVDHDQMRQLSNELLCHLLGYEADSEPAERTDD